MTAHVHNRGPGPDLNNIVHLRLFDPLATIAATARGVDSPELDRQLAVMALQYPDSPMIYSCRAELARGSRRIMLRPMPPYVRPSKQIGLRLPPEIYNWIQKVAKEEDRSAANVIKRILAAEMAREAKREKTKSAKS